MSDAISETFDQTLITIRDKAIDPLYLPIYYLTGKTVALRSKLRQIDANCRAVRSVIHDFIRKRRSGEKQSSVREAADLLSLFMANPTEFPDEVIVDEIMDFFVAGAQTTQLTTQTIIGHFATDTESLEEVRREFREQIAENSERNGSALVDYLGKVVTLADCQELDYLNMVICEALRVNPPVPSSSMYTVTKDTKLGRYNFRAGDSLVVNFTGLQV